MVFSSISFIYYFIPLVLIMYFVAEKSGRIEFKNAVVLIASIIFYSWGGVRYLFLLLFLVFVNYYCGIKISQTKHKRLFLVIGLSVDILDLIIFKYLNFIASNFEAAFSNVMRRDFSLGIPFIALPIGISFFTFQIMSYLIDVYEDKVPAQTKVFRLMLYIMMFPQLIAGPIVRYSDVNKEISERKTTYVMAERGIRRFIIGFAKKVFVANAMGNMADAVFSLSGRFNTAYAWIGAISYTLQIYFDFSAYSDMAIGLGLLFGFHFNENFKYPYISKSVQEFWRRWHISLSTWFRDYVYIPLGGNRQGKWRTYFNLCVVFLLTGIWHGAAWQFIVWGVYHGAFMLIERVGFGKVLKKLPGWIGYIYTMIVVIVGWVFFRADNIGQAINYLRNMFVVNLDDYRIDTVLLKISNWYIFMLVIAICASVQAIKYLKKIRISEWGKNIAYLALFIVTVIYLSGLSYNPFIYYKF